MGSTEGRKDVDGIRFRSGGWRGGACLRCGSTYSGSSTFLVVVEDLAFSLLAFSLYRVTWDDGMHVYRCLLFDAWLDDDFWVQGGECQQKQGTRKAEQSTSCHDLHDLTSLWYSLYRLTLTLGGQSLSRQWHSPLALLADSNALYIVLLTNSLSRPDCYACYDHPS